MPHDRTYNLLLVEDEAILALDERRILERNGYAVDVAHSGEDAVDRVRSNPDIDLVLMDIDLGPGIDGTEAAGRILELCELPIVFLTSHTEPEFVERVKEITGYGYVVKNSGEFVLVQSIEMALQLCGSHSQTLREKERYRSLVENTNDAVVIHDFDGLITFANGRAAALLGYGEDELLGTPLHRIQTPTAREQLKTFIADSHRRERTIVETEVITKTGEIIPVEVSAVVTSHSGGGEIQAFVRDIRQRKEAEKAFRAIYSDTDETIAMFDRDGRILQINRAAAQTLGTEQAGLVGRKLSELHDPQSAEQALSGIREVFDTGKSRTAEWHTYIAGTKRWFRIHTEPVWDSSGHVNYVTTFGIEITDLKQAEENYRLIAEYAHDVVAVLDGDFDPLYISSSAERLFGYSIEDFAHKSIFDFVHAEDRDEILSAARLDIERGLENATRTFRVVTKGGEVKWAEINSTYLYDETGRKDRIILNARDITQRERVRRELAHTSSRLEATLDAMPELFFELDAELRFRDYRAPDVKELYADPSHFLGARAREILPESVVEKLSDAVKRTHEGESTTTFDYSLPDGEQARFFRASVARESTHESDRYVVLVRDITELVRTHEELRTLIAEKNTLLRELNHRVPNTASQMTSDTNHT